MKRLITIEDFKDYITKLSKVEEFTFIDFVPIDADNHTWGIITDSELDINIINLINCKCSVGSKLQFLITKPVMYAEADYYGNVNYTETK